MLLAFTMPSTGEIRELQGKGRSIVILEMNKIIWKKCGALAKRHVFVIGMEP